MNIPFTVVLMLAQSNDQIFLNFIKSVDIICILSEWLIFECEQLWLLHWNYYLVSNHSKILNYSLWANLLLNLFLFGNVYYSTFFEIIILDICKPFESIFSKLWEYGREIMNCIWCQNIDPSYQTNVISLLNFSTTLRQACGIVAMLP